MGIADASRIDSGQRPSGHGVAHVEAARLHLSEVDVLPLAGLVAVIECGEERVGTHDAGEQVAAGGAGEQRIAVGDSRSGA